MSSDTFYVEVRAIAGDTVELVCQTSGAGGLSDYADTRSFVLSALLDGLPYGGKLPLQRALAALSEVKVWEEAFHREHVDKFVTSVELVSRHGIIDNERAWFSGRESLDDAEAARDYPHHSFVLRARVTDPQWLKGQKVGKRFGTTSFDAWFKDPKSPTPAQRKAVEAAASRWQPPSEGKAAAGKKTAGKKSAGKKSAVAKTAVAKAPAKKTGAKKTAAKKTAVKKAAVKKAAVKKAAVKKTAVKKTAAKKTAGKKTAVKKTAVVKTAVKKTAAKKTPAKKTAAKKTAAKKSSSR